jgi:hypothetical protein
MAQLENELGKMQEEICSPNKFYFSTATGYFTTIHYSVLLPPSPQRGEISDNSTQM